MKKLRRKGFSRKGFRAYLETHPNQRHKCSDSEKCIVANYIANEVDFPKGLDRVQVWGNTVEFSNSKGIGGTITYEAPKWVDRVVRRFDDIRSKSGKVTSEKALKELQDLLV